ncbi:cation diffusion facilitator family transporter [Pelagibius marinus]|uniref:cation diffusion facilitator family transporter n=1 Tax=Pelagibius marinus TaxID=2762760 RepID=UPI0018729F3A|nr:cation transporter [Pelagibius marinus]
MAGAPTPEQIAKERAVLYTALADLSILVLQIIFATLTRSLSLLSEAIRVGLMLTIEFYTYFVLRAVHRGRLGKFRFGIGQLEQMCNLVIGACLVLSGLWVAQEVVRAILLGEAAASPLGLATAAVINGINLTINVLGWFAMVSAARPDDSAIFSAQLRARTVKLLSSIIVQTTMTAAALAKDPLVAAWLDGLGASFVGVLMVAIGARMVWSCLPDLLDRAVQAELSVSIDSILDEAKAGTLGIAQRRTRRAGSFPHIELTLSTTGCVWVSDFLERAGELETRLRSQIPDADITIAVHETGSTGLESN